MSTRASALLLRVRALQELMARREVAQAATEQLQAETDADRAEIALAALLVPTVSAPPAFLAVAAAQRSGAVLLTTQRSLAAAAARRADEAREAWQRAEAARSSAEHLDEALRDQARHALERADQRAIDDLASARHGRPGPTATAATRATTATATSTEDLR